MATLKIEIETKGDAFGSDDFARDQEAARLLAKVAQEIADGRVQGPIIEINGNKCGSWWFEGGE